MQLTNFLTTLALAATATAAAVAITPPPTESSALEVRGAKTCPAEAPNYCGWFDQVNGLPPRCLPVRPNPPVITRPICGRKSYPYCARGPNEFCPYDPAHKFCKDDGVAIVLCIDIDLDVSAVQKLLGEVYCVVDKAFDLLGLQCLLNPGKCTAEWTKFKLGCTPAELVILIKVGLCVVVKGVVGLLGKILGVGINIGIGIGIGK